MVKVRKPYVTQSTPLDNQQGTGSDALVMFLKLIRVQGQMPCSWFFDVSGYQGQCPNLAIL